MLVILFGIGAGLIVWKSRVGHTAGRFSHIDQNELNLLVKEFAESNPFQVASLKNDPDGRKEQIKNLKQLFAFANEAQKQGLANESPYREELENIRAEVIANSYDQFKNKDKGQMPQLGFITEKDIQEFWGESENQNKTWFENLKDKIGLGRKDREFEFDRFIKNKLALLKKQNPQLADRKLSDEELKQARDFYARIRIYYEEYEQKAASGELPKEFTDLVEFKVKLEQAKYLVGLLVEKVRDKIKATDAEIDKYIAEHPELNPQTKKQKAEEVLARAKNNEDFAALADQFSDDPGNNDTSTGKKRGGLYPNVRVGQMVKPFEDAALSLEPGQIYPNLVETDYGYHIIKLESKEQGPPDASGNPTTTYSVRHILISTGVNDPENPLGGSEPLRQYVQRKIEDEKQKKLIDEIVNSNPVEAPEDFEVPDISDQPMQNRMKEHMELSNDGEDTPSSNQKETGTEKKNTGATKSKTK
ncbi:MAG TPA: peptidylprolyl isomerase [Pyrinomonadaceae bacterium]|nr:peptidylprolyl isomerase [Pyrinomonadaceae bacterium]